MTAPVQQSQPGSEHTPTPWCVKNEDAIKIKDAKGDSIASMYHTHLRGRRPTGEVEANAAFIVEAVNSHAALKSQVEEQDKLLAAAADFLNYANRMDAMDLGAEITAYRLKQQKGAALSLEGRGGAT